jgi:flagellar hook protein FlgE
MFGSFITALSALHAAGTGIDAVGHNLANLNTFGFKRTSVSFRDLVAEVGGSGLQQIGSGVSSPMTIKQFVQGTIQTTNGRLDAAVQGDGFFIVRPANSSAADPSARLYTRAGDFRIDENGILISATGEHVQGWSLNTIAGQVNPSDPIGDIVVPVGSNRAAKGTTNFSINMNLDASATTGSPFAVPVNVYDSLGNSHVLSVTFTKTGANAWDANVSSSDPAIGSITPAGPWSFTFDSTGALSTVAGAGYDTTTGLIKDIGITLTNGATSPQKMDWAPWDTVPVGTTPGVGRISQFAQPSASSALSQDGLPAALLTSVSINKGGGVLAQFSNGSQLEVARLPLASIRNPDTLVAIGSNNYRIGTGTADPVIGEASTGGRGDIVGGAVESSNVDIAEEFTRLITLQRTYQANSRMITTTDEISQDTINLKR